MTVYAEAARRLRTVITFLEEEGIPIPGSELTGNLGEWLVMDKLVDHGYEPTLHSGQHDFDIELTDGTRVEVKSGRYDDEDSLWRFDNIRPDRFDILVVVRFRAAFEREVFYVFDSDEALESPPRSKSDTSDERRIIRLREDPTRHQRSDMQSLNERIADYRDAWEKLPE